MFVVLFLSICFLSLFGLVLGNIVESQEIFVELLLRVNIKSEFERVRNYQMIAFLRDWMNFRESGVHVRIRRLGVKCETCLLCSVIRMKKC